MVDLDYLENDVWDAMNEKNHRQVCIKQNYTWIWSNIKRAAIRPDASLFLVTSRIHVLLLFSRHRYIPLFRRDSSGLRMNRRKKCAEINLECRDVEKIV